MRVFHKLLCFLLCIAILGTATIGVVLAEEQSVVTEEYEKTYQIEFLELLGITDPMSSDNYSALVTREEFAYYIARVMGIDVSGYKDIRWYTDISKDSYAFASVNALYEWGVISPDPNQQFRPKELITYAEAYTMLLNAMGYKELAAVYGVWPVGYQRIARNLDIDRPEMYTTISFIDCCALIYDAIKAPLYDITSITEDGNIVYNTSAETLLSNVFSVYVTKGCIESVYGGSLDTQKILSDNRMVVSGVEYPVSQELSVREYLGNYAEVFYRKSGTAKTVIYVSTGVQIMADAILDIDDFDGIQDGTINFFTESGNNKAYRLENGYILLYNGMPLSRCVEETLQGLNKGTIVLKDSDNDRAYDVVSITDYKNLVVRGYNSNTKVIQDKLDSSYSVALKEKDYARIDTDEEEISPEDLSADVILSVAESINGEIVYMVATVSILNGTLEEIYTNGKKVKINGEYYETDDRYWNTLVDEVVLGQAYSFHFDHLGKIAYISAADTREMRYGYLMNAAESDDVFTKQVKVRMLTEEDTIAELLIAKKVILDGIEYTDHNFVNNYFREPSGKVKPQLVEYQLDGKGEIKKIDTLKDNGDLEDPDYSLRAVYSETDDTMNDWVQLWNGGVVGRYGIKAIFGAKTITFCVAEGENPEDKYFYIQPWSKAVGGAEKTGKEFRVYYRSDESAYIDVMVVPVSTEQVNQQASKAIMVTEIGEALEEDENKLYLKGYNSSGGEEVFYAEKELLLENIKMGDLVSVKYATAGTIIEVKQIYDRTQPEPANFEIDNGTLLLLHDGDWIGDYRHYLQLSFGYAKKMFHEGVLSWSRHHGGLETERSVMPNTIVIYDTEKNQIYIGDYNDIVTQENDSQNCSRIFYHTYLGQGNGMFVYN